METATVTMKLRLANKSDLYDTQTGYRNGLMYFMKSHLTQKFDPFPYYLTEDTDKKELNIAFKADQLFVPVRLFDECVVDFRESA